MSTGHSPRKRSRKLDYYCETFKNRLNLMFSPIGNYNVVETEVD